MGWKRQACLKAGSMLPAGLVNRALGLAETLEMGQWLRASGFATEPAFSSREALFEKVAVSIEDRVVLYLEFGVWRGASIKTWSRLLKNPRSILHGFDSFLGLPEDWIPGIDKGHFSTGGAIPVVDDDRVRFFKGWFHETLPAYTIPEHEVLVLNVDCDLYQPARYVLDTLAPHFRRGDFIYFDEFHLPRDEVRAFREFSRNSKLSFSLLGATEGFAGAVFKCQGVPDGA